MKRHILILLIAATTFLVSFHKVEAQTPILIDYAAADVSHASNIGSDAYFTQWKVNKRYQSSAADTSGNYTCKWAAVRFDSIFNYFSSTGYPFASTSLRIDTLQLDVNHQKNSGSNDTLMISVLQRAVSLSGITSVDNGITWTNPVLWDTMIVTNTSLTPGLALNDVGHLSIPCHLNLPLGTKFFVKVDFTGDTVNHFYMIDYWRTDCVPFDPNSASASESIFPLNSWRYYNMFLLPSSDLSGVAGLIYGSFPSNCNLHYFQNWGIAINAVATVPPLTANAGNNDTICSGDAVQLTAFGSGGTLPYSFSWSPSVSLSAGNIPNPLAAPSLTTLYLVTVMDALGATAVDSVLITVNPSPSNINFNVTNPSCYGTSNGEVCAIVSGGTIPYSFMWSNGNRVQCNSNILAGTYTITATDDNGCSISSFVTITQPSPISVVLSSSSDGIYPDTVCISSVSGGVPAYTYSYGGNFNPLPNNCFELLSGTFDVTVTDANGCTAVSSSSCAGFQIDSIVTTDVSCFGGSDGTACAFVSGGTLPIDYLWSNGATGQCINGIIALNYTAVIIDANGCTISDIATINEPSQLQVTYTKVDVQCNGNATGSIDLTVTGGTPSYLALWSHNATTLDIFGLAAGSYNVTVSDSIGCTATETITITETTAIQSNLNVTDATCGQCNGEALASVSGGAGPYTFQYFDVPPVTEKCTATFCDALCGGNQYVLVITDATGCIDSTFFTVGFQSTLQVDSMVITNPSCIFGNNGAICAIVSGGQSPYAYEWSNGANTACIDSLPDGSYTVTVTDANNCFTIGTATINGQSTLQVDSMATTNASCNGGNDGAICVIVSGGPQPYDYQWSNGQTTQCIDSLLAGFYIVTVTDANGCTVTGTTSIIGQSTFQIDSIVTTDVSCNGGWDGSACPSLSGGTLPYQYLWSTGHTTQCLVLNAGNHYLTVIDANGCIAEDTATITEPTPLTAQFVYTSDGVIPDTVTCFVNGGVPPYTINWSTGDTSVGDTVTNIYLVDGIYLPEVTDSNGCTFTDTIVIGAGCAASCVWPGDADGNGIADNNDLLPIGLAYGTTGNIRLQQDVDWYPHVSQDWADTLSTGVNYKHVDCNGDGTINSDDTLAIMQNFGLIHLKNNTRKPWRASETALYVDLTPDTTHVGDTMYANLTLGDVNIPAANVYALAFTVNYNALVVDSSKTTVTFGNSWLGTATDKISIAKDLSANGELKCAITRIDHTTRSGFGQIGQVSFIITTDNINGKDLIDYYTMEVWISDLVMIDSAGTIIPANEGADSTQVEFEPSSVRNQTLSIGTLTIQPNPANNEVHLSVSNNLMGAEIKLFDIEGRMMLSKTINTTTEKLNTSAFANGMYLVQVKNEKGVLTQRLAIAQ